MAQKKKKPTFEEALQELEEITRSLESGGLTLDDSIQAYERGIELRKICTEILNGAERKLQYLERNESGEIQIRDLGSGGGSSGEETEEADPSGEEEEGEEKGLFGA